MKERFKSYTAQKKNPGTLWAETPGSHLRASHSVNILHRRRVLTSKSGVVIDLLKSDLVCAFFMVCCTKRFHVWTSKQHCFVGKKKVCYGVYLDKSSFILFFGVLWILMSFDGDGDREEDDMRTLRTYIIPPVFTDAFMQTLKDEKNTSCPGGNWTFILSAFGALIIFPFSLSGPSCQYLLHHCDSFSFYLPLKFSPSATRYWRSVKI